MDIYNEIKKLENFRKDLTSYTHDSIYGEVSEERTQKIMEKAKGMDPYFVTCVERVVKKTDKTKTTYKAKKLLHDVFLTNDVLVITAQGLVMTKKNGTPDYEDSLERKLMNSPNSLLNNMEQDNVDLLFKAHKGQTYNQVLRTYIDNKDSALAKEGSEEYQFGEERNVENLGDAYFLMAVLSSYNSEQGTISIMPDYGAINGEFYGDFESTGLCGERALLESTMIDGELNGTIEGEMDGTFEGAIKNLTISDDFIKWLNSDKWESD